MSIELKIKFKSLAEEARIIRQEERKLLSRARSHSKSVACVFLSHEEHEERLRKAAGFRSYFEKISNHRRGKVRLEARKTHLARGFLKGTPYNNIETTCRNFVDIDDLYKLLKRYSTLNDNELKDALYSWYHA